MKQTAVVLAGLGALLALVLAGCGAGELLDQVTTQAADPPYNFLVNSLEQPHQAFCVRTEASAAADHFPVLGKIGAIASLSFDEAYTVRPRTGATCVRCVFAPTANPQWAGVYLLNGVLQGNEVAPTANWGTAPGSFNLTGATKVTFYARGAVGGERARFFVGGTGWQTTSFGESFKQVSLPWVTLTTTWTRFDINLVGQNLSKVLTGLAWVTDTDHNGFKRVEFCVDDVSWDKPHQADSGLPVSYVTQYGHTDFDRVMPNAAFTYDSCIALLAFLAANNTADRDRARRIADSLVYATQHDRFYGQPWLRNAYMGADLAAFPGWVPHGRTGTARMPGFWDAAAGRWYEDYSQVSISTGNVAWTMIALLAAHGAIGNASYLATAQALGNWVELNCATIGTPGGYTLGFDGRDGAQQKATAKSTEHNLDLYVAFKQLNQKTGNPTWQQRANKAYQFVQAMWDEEQGKYWTGTRDGGATPETDYGRIPVDVQAWSMLALPTEARPRRALTFAEKNHLVMGGFDFNTDRDGLWWEGTAQMACAYTVAGQGAKASAVLSRLAGSILGTGAVPAASKDGLTTGFKVRTDTGEVPWLYYRRGHVGATAWYLLARSGKNPYWL